MPLEIIEDVCGRVRETGFAQLLGAAFRSAEYREQKTVKAFLVIVEVGTRPWIANKERCMSFAFAIVSPRLQMLRLRSRNSAIEENTIRGTNQLAHRPELFAHKFRLLAAKLVRTRRNRLPPFLRIFLILNRMHDLPEREYAR
jgi:hypothetical protein